jgi:hypothetical protein
MRSTIGLVTLLSLALLTGCAGAAGGPNGPPAPPSAPVAANTDTLAVYPSALPDAQSGTPWAATVTTNGRAPIQWSVTGELPPGFAPSPNGPPQNNIMGVCNESGTYTFTIHATDETGATGETTYTIAVGSPVTTCAPLLVTSPAANLSLPDGTVGQFYSQTTTVSGGTAPYTFGALYLPQGLSLTRLTADTLALSGTPRLGGNDQLLVDITDASGNSLTASYFHNSAPPSNDGTD